MRSIVVIVGRDMRLYTSLQVLCYTFNIYNHIYTDTQHTRKARNNKVMHACYLKKELSAGNNTQYTEYTVHGYIKSA